MPGRAGRVETLSLNAPENIFLTGEDGEIVLYPWNTFEKESCVLYEEGMSFSPRQVLAVEGILNCLKIMPSEISWTIASGLEEAVYLSMVDESVYIPETPVILGNGESRLFSMAFRPEGISYAHMKSEDTHSGDSSQVELALSLLEEARAEMGVGQGGEDSATEGSDPIVSPQPGLPSPGFSENPYMRFLETLRWIYEFVMASSDFMVFTNTVADFTEAISYGECATLYREGETLVSFTLLGQPKLILFFGEDASGHSAITGFSMKH